MLKGRSMALTRVFNDPATLCDEMRRIDRQTNNCGGCRFDMGKAWGRQVCKKGKQPDKEGYCRAWEKKEKRA